MKRTLLTTALTLLTLASSYPCTNIIVGKNASTDGSVFCTYNADSYGAFMQMVHYAPQTYALGDSVAVVDWDTNRPWGHIPQASRTYNVLGNINEYQVAIGETTFGGREEMVDSTGVMDYGSLIYLALQRAQTAREAISVMTTLAETYGYNSEGETFSICDPNEAWIMEMMGQGPQSHKVVYVALRIPDNALCAHANQSRITTFTPRDTANVIVSPDCISYARQQGWYTGDDEHFSFRDAYCPPDFEGRRACEARVWAIYNHYQDMTPYLDFVCGYKPVAECRDLPLWIFPDEKVSLHDVQQLMRDHFEGTPFALDNDLGEGLWQMPYRPTPLVYDYDGAKYFNERPVSTQQTGFTFVVQLRAALPREIGGVIWFANDDPNMVPLVPVYCANTTPPPCFNDSTARWDTFSINSAYWVSNWVSNMVYPRYAQMFKDVERHRDALDSLFQADQQRIEQQALELYRTRPHDAVAFLTAYSCSCGDYFMDTWRDLAWFLVVKYNDMVEKPTDGDTFIATPYGFGEKVIRMGYPPRTRQRLLESTGDRFRIPDAPGDE